MPTSGFDPPSRAARPTTTIFPSAWSAAASPRSVCPAMSVTTLPPMPNVPSSAPPEVRRAAAKSLPRPSGPEDRGVPREDDLAVGLHLHGPRLVGAAGEIDAGLAAGAERRIGRAARGEPRHRHVEVVDARVPGDEDSRRTVCGDCRFAAASASRRKRVTAIFAASPPRSSSLSGRISLIAAGRFKRRCVALYTSPMPPRPKSSPSW